MHYCGNHLTSPDLATFCTFFQELSVFISSLFLLTSLSELDEVHSIEPVTVAERSKACTVFARSEAAIVGWKPTQGMDV
jgi:hypothetical protein